MRMLTVKSAAVAAFALLAMSITSALAAETYDIRGVRVGAAFAPPAGADCKDEDLGEGEKRYNCQFPDQSRLFAQTYSGDIVSNVRYEFRIAEDLTPASTVGKSLTEKYGSYKKVRQSWVWSFTGKVKLTAECWNNFCALTAEDPRVWIAEKEKRKGSAPTAAPAPKF